MTERLCWENGAQQPERRVGVSNKYSFIQVPGAEGTSGLRGLAEKTRVRRSVQVWSRKGRGGARSEGDIGPLGSRLSEGIKGMGFEFR
jgi:hypothetical protein